MIPNEYSTGFWVLSLVTLAVVGFGLWRRLTDGHVRQAMPAEIPGIPLGRTATFVQFSSPVCAPCTTTRRLLQDLARIDGVQYVDLDVRENLDLVRKFEVSRTPTTLVLDPQGQVRHRILGVPRRAELDALIVPVESGMAS